MLTTLSSDDNTSYGFFVDLLPLFVIIISQCCRRHFDVLLSAWQVTE